MNPNHLETLKSILKSLQHSIASSFDKTAAWVSKLSWWKFFLFAMLAMAAGGIVQSLLFDSEESTVVTHTAPIKAKRSKAVQDGDANIQIDANGIHIRKENDSGKNQHITIDEKGVRVHEEDDEKDSMPEPPPMPEPNSGMSGKPPSPPAKVGQDDIHIKLPPEVAKEISNDIEDAVADAADEEVKTYKKKSSDWFMRFVSLLLFGLLGMKALMGGKVKAEEKARQAHDEAEREALRRQVSEAQMQMMQAQVEPHFLFNTLASVEHLIETDPPRAAAMQRSLIQYLRAVLPQMRQTSTSTNLGREADMVKSYLELLKMRMEERLTVEFHMPEGLRSASFPPMMLQSLVENAIKHGLECKAEGGTIQFKAEVADKRLRVSVTDDGLGFGVMPSNGTGLGLQNIRERLKLIYKDSAQIIITPNQPSGVCVTIELPYELAN
jgi:chemotaxis protein histidine kinase CheA